MAIFQNKKTLDEESLKDVNRGYLHQDNSS